VSNTVVKGNILMQGSHGDVWLPTPSATLSETESTVTNAHDNWDV
jgi:hypothetical protein